jgi:hypothetical protein
LGRSSKQNHVCKYFLNATYFEHDQRHLCKSYFRKFCIPGTDVMIF